MERLEVHVGVQLHVDLEALGQRLPDEFNCPLALTELRGDAGGPVGVVAEEVGAVEPAEILEGRAGFVMVTEACREDT